jgi:hypothetical protein
LNEDILSEFKHTTKDMFKFFYKPYKIFKLIPSGEYLTTALINPYQYIVVMLCKLYKEKDASKFIVSLDLDFMRRMK